MKKYLLFIDFLILISCTYLALIGGVLLFKEANGMNFFYPLCVVISWSAIFSIWYLLIQQMRIPEYLIKPESMKFFNLMKYGAVLCLLSFILLIVLLGLHEIGFYFLREKNNFVSYIQHGVWFTLGVPFLFPYFHLIHLKKQLTSSKTVAALGRGKPRPF